METYPRPPWWSRNSLERTIIELPDLSREQFVELALRIKALVDCGHPQAPQSISAAQIEELAAYVRDRSGDQISTLVRSVVLVMLQAQQEPDFDFASTYPFLVEEQIEELQRELTEG